MELESRTSDPAKYQYNDAAELGTSTHTNALKELSIQLRLPIPAFVSPAERQISGPEPTPVAPAVPAQKQETFKERLKGEIEKFEQETGHSFEGDIKRLEKKREDGTPELAQEDAAKVMDVIRRASGLPDSIVFKAHCDRDGNALSAKGVVAGLITNSCKTSIRLELSLNDGVLSLDNAECAPAEVKERLKLGMVRAVSSWYHQEIRHWSDKKDSAEYVSAEKRKEVLSAFSAALDLKEGVLTDIQYAVGVYCSRTALIAGDKVHTDYLMERVKGKNMVKLLPRETDESK